MTPRRRPGGIFPRYSPSEDVAREVRAHLEMREEELRAQGWDAAEARAEARRLFGDVEAVERDCVRINESRERAVERGRMMGELWQDVRYAVRALVKAPAFTVVALVTLGLGIGATTAVFSVVNGVLLRPLPFPDPDELVFVGERSQRGGVMSVAWANFRDWRAEAGSFEALAAYGSGTTTVLGGSEPAWATVAYVSEDFWRVFGVTPRAGRLLVGDDHAPGAAAVVVVSPDFALSVLGTDDPVGRSVEAFGTLAQVVGVAPSDFDYPSGVQLWAPIGPQGDSRTAHNWSVVGRLRDGVSVETASREMDALMVRIAATASADEPSEYLAVGTLTEPLRERIVGDSRRPLLILLGAAALVLLVACTNLASTLLARGTARRNELAVRSALGAGRGRLLRQFLTESVVLSVGGALVGLGVASAVVRLLRRFGSASVPRLEAVALDAPVLAFTLVAAVLTALVFGLLPALRATEGVQAGTLRSGRGNAGSRSRVWSLLVATEVALALVLLVGSGLLVRSFVAVMAEDAGFDGTDVMTTTVALSGVKYPELRDRAALWDDLLARVEAAPGVAAAGLTTSPPLGRFAPNGQVLLDGDPTKVGDGVYVVASRGTFAALDIPLLRGRLFEAADGPDAPHVVLVSQSFADRYWPGEDPLGHRVSGGGMDDYWDAAPPVFGTVVGVVGDVRYQELTREGEPTVYWHYRQRPYRIRFGATLVAEAIGGDPAPLAPVVRATVRAADPDVAVPLRVLQELVSDSVAQRRFLLLVLAGFGGVALVLAAVGIYGVVSYGVARRTREMGIRLALGAAPASVRSLVLGGALRPVVAGLVAGTIGGLVLTRFMRSLLYEVPPTDPVTFTLVPLLLLGAAVVASWVPARRGTRVDPEGAMRTE
ncbi:MAG: hypothetical protein AMXMBFR53_12840 [Gemmatimonadota bacterium]